MSLPRPLSGASASPDLSTGVAGCPFHKTRGAGDPRSGKAIPLPHLSPTPLDLLCPYIPDHYGLPKHLYNFWFFLGWSQQRFSKTHQFGGLCLFNHALPFPCYQPLAALVILLACWVLCIAGLLWRWSLPFLLVSATHGSRASKGLSSQEPQGNFLRVAQRRDFTRFSKSSSYSQVFPHTNPCILWGRVLPEVRNILRLCITWIQPIWLPKFPLHQIWCLW